VPSVAPGSAGPRHQRTGSSHDFSAWNAKLGRGWKTEGGFSLKYFPTTRYQGLAGQQNPIFVQGKKKLSTCRLEIRVTRPYY
jgi:hypothetical protein